MNGFGTQFKKLPFWSLIHIIHMEKKKDCNLTIRYNSEGFSGYHWTQNRRVIPICLVNLHIQVQFHVFELCINTAKTSVTNYLKGGGAKSKLRCPRTWTWTLTSDNAVHKCFVLWGTILSTRVIYFSISLCCLVLRLGPSITKQRKVISVINAD